MYEQIPGSGYYENDPDSGMFTFPCQTTVQVALTFGGLDYTIDPVDFNGGAVDEAGETCLGAIFMLGDTSGSGLPDVIAGDTFMKSYFSAFQLGTQGKPQVGFAALPTAGTAQTLSATATYVTATSALASVSSVTPAFSQSTPAAAGTGVYWPTAFSAPVASGTGTVATAVLGPVVPEPATDTSFPGTPVSSVEVIVPSSGIAANATVTAPPSATEAFPVPTDTV